MKRQKQVISLLLHALLMTTVYVFQGVIFPFLRLNGLVPLLLPLVCTGIAVRQGTTAGGISGLFAGMLCDVSFNESVGLFMLLLTLFGLVVGLLADTVFTRGFMTYFFCSAVVLAAASIVQMFPLLFFARVAPSPLFSTALGQTVYSLVFVVPLWFFVRSLGRITTD